MDEMERRTQQARRFYRRRGESSLACVVRGTACDVRWAWRIAAGLCHAFPWCCHSNATSAPIANPPNSAQLGGIPYQSPKLIRVRAILWACGRRQAERHTDARDHNTRGRGFDTRSRRGCVTTPGKLFTPLSPTSMIWYRSLGGDDLWLGR